MKCSKREARRSIAILALLVANLFVGAAQAKSYNLSKEDILFLQEIAKQDEFVRRLGESDPGIRGLGGTVLKTTVDLPRATLIQSTLAAPAINDDTHHGL